MFYSKAVEYAIRALIYLAVQARETPERFIDVKVVAQEGNLPEMFTAKILQQLGKRGFVDSKKGARGGWRMRQLPSMITLAELIIELDGNPRPTTFISERVIETLNRYLTQTTIADLAKAAKRRAA